MPASSQLRRYASAYLGETGWKCIHDRMGVEREVYARAVEVRTQVGIARAGQYATHGNVFDVMMRHDAVPGGGDILAWQQTKGNASSWVRVLLYSADEHHVAERHSHMHLYGLRVNVSRLEFRRLDATSAGPNGGLSGATTVVARDVEGHLYVSNEQPRKDPAGRTMDCDAALMVRSGLGIADQDTVAVAGETFEVQGFDANAMSGVVVLKLRRAK